MNVNDSELGHEGVEAIAIIGMDGRFPGADDVGAFWRNLLDERETIDRFDDEALDASIPAELREQPEYVRARGVLREADCFDAEFFGVSPREAEVLDPQQRVFLEMCWRALEDAGYAPGTHDALTGVFAGMSNNTYFNAHVAKHPRILAGYGEIPAMVANEKDYLATRVGYKLNLRGPCINICTACSTSLVAVCHAFNSLLDYQCDIALAGGISVLCPQERGYLYQEGSIYSPDGHCRPFDADARGTVFGNGGGVVVLKRLSDALADGDTIHAVIRGAAMNNDGAGRVSFTAPGVDGQAEVIQMAQELADIRGDRIGYVEAHGTGTSLGDPIEVEALTRAFRLHTDRRGHCGIGSVKGNIGHLDAASGIAGLIKTTLALREKRLPATLHYRKPNPEIDFESSPFRVVNCTRDWPADGGPRRAAVSSFGLGGTNAHVVLEEAPPTEASSTGRSHQLLALSAKSEAALERARESLAGWLADNPNANFADVAFTLQRGRQAFEHRLTVAAQDATEAAELLNTRAAVRRGKARTTAPGTVFMFPGQGSQYAGMCAQLYREEPLVKDIIDRCADALADTLEFDLRDVMFDRIDNATELLDETAYTQPALFVAEYALARLWMQWGVRPAALIGHSIGEFVAAALANVFRPEDAVRVVAERGRLMQEQDAGSMLSVRLSETDVQEYLVPGVTLAGANAPDLCVVSGDDSAIHRMKTRLDAREIGCRMLRTSHAFHSAMMDPAVDSFRAFLADIPLSPPNMEIISTVTGRRLGAEDAVDPEYWARQLREPVRFMNALQAARGEDGDAIVFLEVGPGIATATFATQTLAGERNVQVIGSLGRHADSQSEYAALLGAAGRLWTQGMPLDWQAMHAGETRHRVPVPTYRFERTRYWLDSTGTRPQARPEVSAAPEPAADDRPLTEQLAGLLEEVSGIVVTADRYGTGFAEMDLDSLFLTQFSAALKKRFGVNLRFRELLVEHNSIAAVARLIESQRPSKGQGKTKSAEKEPPPRKHVETLAARPELTEPQRSYLQELSRRYTWRTSGSKAFVRTHRSHLADPRAASGFDPLLKEMVYPIVTKSSSGSHIQDVDGNGYIDLVNGFGSSLLGHSAPAVTDAIRQQLRRGYDVGPQTPLAGRVARLLQAMTGFERIAFCTTGSEAVQAAIRVARTVTGREKIVTFADDYHGGFDEMLARRGEDGGVRAGSPGVPGNLVAGVEVLEYGSDASVRRIRELDDQLAAVLVEPVQARHPERHSPAFLRALRAATKQSGAALVFDEMITGFRTHPGGIQERCGVRADLATYGKVCGGGMPLGVLAGTPDFMDAIDGGDWQYNDDSAPRPGVTFLAGTSLRHPLSLAAAEAVLTHLQEAGPGLQRTLDKRTEELVNELERHCEEAGAPIAFRRFSSWFLIDIDERVPHGELLYYRLRAGGIHAWPDRLCFLTTAHTDADIAQIAGVFREAVDEMRAAGFFEAVERTSKTAPAAEPLTGTDGASAPPAPGARLGRRPDGQPGWFVPDPDRPGRYRELKTELRTP